MIFENLFGMFAGARRNLVIRVGFLAAEAKWQCSSFDRLVRVDVTRVRDDISLLDVWVLQDLTDVL
jgi:hypothetical protein